MKSPYVAWAGALLCLAAPAPAQDTVPIVMGMYLRCNQGQESRADQIIRQAYRPLVQKQIAAGRLTGWVVFSHVQGGAWRRLVAVTGTDLGTMLDARAQVTQEFTTQHQAAATEIGTICPGHDDYIWTAIANGPAAPSSTPGTVAISTYYTCDRSREARTNAIFSEVLAPLYKKHTDMGHLASWGFFAHRSGGPFRRLETFSGPDFKTLFNMQEAIYGEAQQTAPLAMNEFYQICSSHTDYMWSNATPQ